MIGTERAVQFVQLAQDNEVPTNEFILSSKNSISASVEKESICLGWVIREYQERGRGETLGIGVLEDSRVVAWDGWSGRRCIRHTNYSESLSGDDGLNLLGKAAVRFGIIK